MSQYFKKNSKKFKEILKCDNKTLVPTKALLSAVDYVTPSFMTSL